MTEISNTETKPENRMRSRLPIIIGGAAFLALLTGVGYLLEWHQTEMLAAIEANDMESAYFDVSRSHVSVNGYRGTEQWRGYYAKGLVRVLENHDFDQACAHNGFLRDKPSENTFDCIAADDVRAVRSADGTLSYFRERSFTEEVIRLNVMQQDVHALDYLDIDSFVSAVKDRASMAKAVSRASALSSDALFKDALKTVEPIVIEPLRLDADVSTPAIPDELVPSYAPTVQ